MSNPKLKEAPGSSDAVPELKPFQKFSREVHYQSYRIDKIMASLAPKEKAVFLSSNKEALQKPLIKRFIEAKFKKQMPEFVETFRDETDSERERLLIGIRRIVHGAVERKEKAEAAKRPKAKKKRILTGLEREINDLEKILKKDKLDEGEMGMALRGVEEPFELKYGQKLTQPMIQMFYFKLISGQKALGQHFSDIQSHYMTVAKKLEKFYGKEENWWSGKKSKFNRYLGIVAWGGRKIRGAYHSVRNGLNWVGSKLGLTSRKPKSKTPAEKLNEKVQKVKKIFDNKFGIIKTLKDKIGERSEELKKHVAKFKKQTREKLRNLIISKDWTGAEEAKKKKEKTKMEKLKEKLNEKLEEVEKQSDRADDLKDPVKKAKSTLTSRIENIKATRGNMNSKLQILSKRLPRLRKKLGDRHPMVAFVEKRVYQPLANAVARTIESEIDTKKKLTQNEKFGHKIATYKANLVITETNILTSMDKLDLAVTKIDKRIKTLKMTKERLFLLIESEEFEYGAIDSFESYVKKNIKGISENNEKVVGALGKQRKYLDDAKAKDEGLGTALWNTAIVGKWGAFGILHYGVNKLPTYFGSSKTITGWLNHGMEKWNKWIKKGGAKGALGNVLGTIANIPLGVLNGAAGLVVGVVNIVLDTRTVFDGIEDTFSSRKKLGAAVKEAFHINDWVEGRVGTATGKTGFDVALLFLTAGGSSALKALQAAKHMSKFGRAWQFIKHFSLETARRAVRTLNPMRWGRVLRRGWFSFKKVLPWNWGKKSEIINSKIANEVTHFDTKMIAKLSDDDLAIIKATEEAADKYPSLANILKRLKEKPGTLKKLTPDELARLSKGLDQMFYRVDSIFLRNRLHNISKSLDRYMKFTAKRDGLARLAGEVAPTTEKLANAADPTTRAGMKQLQGDIGRRLQALHRALDADPPPIPPLAKQYADEIALLSKRYNELSWTHRVAKIGSDMVTKLKAIEWKRLSSIADSLRGLKTGEIIGRLGKFVFVEVALFPFWLPIKLAKGFFGKLPKMIQITKTRGIRVNKLAQAMAEYKSMGAISKQINTLLKHGHLRRAVTLFHSCRMIGNKMGISFAVMDKSFLGWLHRYLPITTRLVANDVELRNMEHVEKLPLQVTPPSKAKVQKLESEHAEELRKLYNALNKKSEKPFKK